MLGHWTILDAGVAATAPFWIGLTKICLEHLSQILSGALGPVCQPRISSSVRRLTGNGVSSPTCKSCSRTLRMSLRQV